MTCIKNKIFDLQKLLHYHDYLYFYLDKPIISDDEYDFLFNKLKYLKKKYFIFDVNVKKNNTFDVFNSQFQLNNHITPMLSLDHVFHISKFVQFYKNINKIFNKYNNVNFFCELKFDGLALSIIYDKGKLIRALTRGNGTFGENVTDNAYMINHIFSKLQYHDIPDTFEVRGEVCMLKKDFDILNINCIKNNKKIFANTRNAASGTLRQNNPLIVKKRKLLFYAYSCNIIRGKKKFKNHSDQMYFLSQLGFLISPYILLSSSLNKIVNFYQLMSKIRYFLSFNIDGIVVKVDSIILQKKLGYTNKFPRWSIAVKFLSNSAKTKLLNISYQVGRTGSITPVANLQPTLLSGVIIKKASLYNKNFINKLNLCINDSVIISRVGDVIPKITSVIFSDRALHVNKVNFPKYCPSCNSLLYINSNNTIIQCLAGMNCLEQKKRMIEHFFSKNALYAKGFGSLIIEKLIFFGYIKNVIDCFKLNINIIAQLKDFGKKSANNIVYAIQKSKYTTLERFIYALGIKNIGLEHSKLIAKYFGCLDNILTCTLEQLLDIKKFGITYANIFFEFIKNGNHIRYIKKLIKTSNIVFVKTKNSININKTTFLMKKNIVLSGKFNNYSRKDMIDKICNLGGFIFKTVSKKIDFLIIGDKPGNKVLQASQLNITIVHQNELNNIIY